MRSASGVRAGLVFALCHYCGSETYRAQFAQRSRWLLSEHRAQARVSLRDAAVLVDRCTRGAATVFFCGSFVLLALAAWTAFLRVSVLLSLAAATAVLMAPIWLLRLNQQTTQKP